jgi:hypothetical protein
MGHGVGDDGSGADSEPLKGSAVVSGLAGV